MERLIHDAAFLAAKSIVERLPLPAPDAQAAFGLIYENVKAAIEAFVIQSSREAQRLRPSSN